jgi:hypothetical protein
MPTAFLPTNKNALRAFAERIKRTVYWIVKVTVAVCCRLPEAAVIVTVVVPVGVPGLEELLLLPPPQAGIHRVKHASSAIIATSRMARLRFPAGHTSPNSPGISRA